MNELDQTKTNHEAQLKEWDLPAHPYVVACGKLESLSHFYVLINGQNIECNSLMQAVRQCYKCLKAFGSFPRVCDHVWLLIERLIYHISCTKTQFAALNTAVQEIEILCNITDPQIGVY